MESTHFERRVRGVALALLVLPVSGPAGGAEPAVGSLPTDAGGARPAGAVVVTHGGSGSPPEVSDGPQAAAEAALARLASGASSLEAALEGTVTMENDPRFNAGTGSNIRLDGKTIQMDAALMDSDGRFAAVAVIERVENPILVAQALLETPHLMLAGQGATTFAHRAGFRDVVPECAESRAKYERTRKALLENEGREGYQAFDWRRFWNFPEAIPDALKGGDTVGTVVRDAGGHFAATLSTGGTTFTLYGRVGDVPIFGAGCYAGVAGAVACTGHGEIIIRQKMATAVYRRLEAGVPAREAVRAAVEGFPEESSIGIIAVSAEGWGVASNRSMAYGMAGND